MTDDTTSTGGTDAESGSTLTAFDPLDEQDDFPEDLTELVAEDDSADDSADDVRRTGAVTGGFGLAGLAGGAGGLPLGASALGAAPGATVSSSSSGLKIPR